MTASEYYRKYGRTSRSMYVFEVRRLNGRELEHTGVHGLLPRYFNGRLGLVYLPGTMSLVDRTTSSRTVEAGYLGNETEVMTNGFVIEAGYVVRPMLREEAAIYEQYALSTVISPSILSVSHVLLPC